LCEWICISVLFMFFTCCIVIKFHPSWRMFVDSNFFHGPIEFEITKVNCMCNWYLLDLSMSQQSSVYCWSRKQTRKRSKPRH
jgi:hypothetical protein